MSLLAVDGTGKTKILSRAWERGIPLSYVAPQQPLDTDEYGAKGLSIIWPESVPRGELVHEDFVFVVTDREADLQFLEPRIDESLRKAQARGPETAFSAKSQIRYHVTHVRYTLRSNQPLAPAHLPAE